MKEGYRSKDLTVVVPAHNASAWIEQTLESVEAQSTRPDSVIVVENGSSDDTGDVVERFMANSSLSIKLIRTQCPGVSNARNLGFSLAETPLIALLDADDIYHPGFLQLALDAYNGLDDLILFFGNRRPLLNGRVVDKPFLENTALNQMSCDSDVAGVRRVTGDLFGEVIRGSFISCSGAVVRREAAYRAGLFPPFLSASEDRYFFSKLVRLGGCAYTLEITHWYRTHEASRTGGAEWLEICQNAVLCVCSLCLELSQGNLSEAESEALKSARKMATYRYLYAASEEGLKRFADAYHYVKTVVPLVFVPPFLWLKALKNHF